MLLLTALLINTGCSGINASKSFSPLDFLLPGILQNQPAAPSPSEPTNPAFIIAQAQSR
jgi:hypothetical protein